MAGSDDASAVRTDHPVWIGHEERDNHTDEREDEEADLAVG